MIRKILAHLASLPPRTNLYANLHFIMPPHNMVIAVMFSRERGGGKKKLSCGSIIEACVLVRLHTRTSPCPRCTMLRTQWTSDRTGNVVRGHAVSQRPSVARCRYTGYTCSVLNRIRPPPLNLPGQLMSVYKNLCSSWCSGMAQPPGLLPPRAWGSFLVGLFSYVRSPVLLRYQTQGWQQEP